MLKKTLLLTFLLSAAAHCEPLFPPEGARVVGSNPELRLTWDGPSRDYFLHILASGRTMVETSVQGNSFEARLVPNVYYTWSVTPAGGQGQTHHFQYSSELRYEFDGARGPAARVHRSLRRNHPGEAGGNGKPGDVVHVYLTPVGPHPGVTAVRIEGQRRKVNFLLLPGSAPISVSARGGDGGEGGAGSNGGSSYQGADGTLVDSTSGLPGGKGGDGGPGGTVIVHNGLPRGTPSPLRIDVGGGIGGLGGPDGADGDGQRGPVSRAAEGKPGLPGSISEVPWRP